MNFYNHCRLCGNGPPPTVDLRCGGRKPLRDALYMPALVAMRFNPDLKKKHQAMRDAGKPAKVAIVAIMRKLIETANALVKENRARVEKGA